MKFHTEISALNVSVMSQISRCFLYFGHTGSRKFPETSTLSPWPHQRQCTSFYRMRTMWALVDAVKIYDIGAVSTGTSRWRHQLHFLFARFLTYLLLARVVTLVLRKGYLLILEELFSLLSHYGDFHYLLKSLLRSLGLTTALLLLKHCEQDSVLWSRPFVCDISI